MNEHETKYQVQFIIWHLTMKSKCITLIKKNFSFMQKYYRKAANPSILFYGEKQTNETKQKNKALYLSKILVENKLQFIFQTLTQNYPDTRMVKRSAYVFQHLFTKSFYFFRTLGVECYTLSYILQLLTFSF